MPSPFPGMDPYLEGSHWSSVHLQMIAEMARHLAPLLDPKYFPFTEEYSVMVVPENFGEEVRQASADVGVIYHGGEKALAPAVAIAPAPIRVPTVMPEPVPHHTVEIREVETGRLVTAIEFLSPTNKRQGYQEYLARRGKFLGSEVHLIEIDLLRKGRRVPVEKPLPSTPYYVYVTRVENRPIAEVWPIALAQPLPRIPVPLLKGDSDVALDLQAVFSEMYERSGLRRVPHYGQPPEIKLTEEQQQWADEILRAAGRK